MKTTMAATGYRITSPAKAGQCAFCEEAAVTSFTRVGPNPRDHKTSLVCEKCLDSFAEAHAALAEGSEEVLVHADDVRRTLPASWLESLTKGDAIAQ